MEMSCLYWRRSGSDCDWRTGSLLNCSETIARGFGLSETLIGLTICSIGTSLPELVTSVVAAKKNQAGMALGNVIGSNIFNILLVGGLASAISPIAMNMNNLIDIVILVIVSVYIMALVWKKQLLTRAGGVSMLVVYALIWFTFASEKYCNLDFTDHSLHSVKTIRRDLFF